LVVITFVISACAGDASDGGESSASEASSPVTVGAAIDTEPALTPTVRDTASDVEPEITGVTPEGFTTATVRITEADGRTCEVCMWLADQSSERRRGLMGVTDLGDAHGMAFLFDRTTAGDFFMFQTVTPLSIAWFAADGAFVSSTDMDPCPSDDSAECERFAPGGGYVLAIEVFQGDLESIGITDGARAEVLGGTELDRCPQTD
jgi:uncharacterized membrane protein (UPF0127 family)